MKQQILIQLEPNELKAMIKDAVKDAVDSLTPRAAPDEVEYITRSQTAKILGIALSTLDLWVKDGRVIKYRINSTVRFKKAEVLDAYKSFRKYER